MDKVMCPYCGKNILSFLGKVWKEMSKKKKVKGGK
jgi:hypothetical protein